MAPVQSSAQIGWLEIRAKTVLRIAINGVSQKGMGDLDELKIEFEELILAEAPIVSRPEDLRTIRPHVAS